MEIDRYPTPPTQERQRPQNIHQASQPEKGQPLFFPEDDPKPKIKNLDPYQEEGSISSFLRASSSTTIDSSGSRVKPEPSLVSAAEGSTPFNTGENHREFNPLPSRGDSRLTKDSDELGKNPLSVKQEFANQDDTESQRIHELLRTVNRSQSPSEGDRLSVKRELENQDGASAQKMYQLLDAVNRGQSTHGDGPSVGMIKRDLETQPMGGREKDPPRNTRSGPQPPAPNMDQDRDSGRGHYSSTSSFSNSNPWRGRNERGGHERERERSDRAWRGDNERGRESVGGGGDRKRYPGDRGDRSSGDRREYPDKRSRASYQ